MTRTTEIHTVEIHTVAWLAWVSASLVALTTTRNPFYLVLLLGWLALVTWSVQTSPAIPRRALFLPFSLVRFGMVIIGASTLFNLLAVHIGNTVWGHLPRVLPLFGGPLTAEAAVYGALNGCALVGILIACLLVNQVTSVRAFIQLVPRAYYPLAIVVAIACTFIPLTFRQFQQVREAQAVRGHRVHGLRNWLPLCLPLLIGGLERALQLAEAMVARGFASVEKAPSSWMQSAQIGGLFVLLSGWLLQLVWQRALLGIVLMLLGAAAVVSILWMAGRGQPHTVYRTTPWQGQDWAVLLGAALVMASFGLPWPRSLHASLFYYPYPALTTPGFHPLLGVATLGLLAPVSVVWNFKLGRWASARELVRKSKTQNRKSNRETL